MPDDSTNTNEMQTIFNLIQDLELAILRVIVNAPEKTVSPTLRQLQKLAAIMLEHMQTIQPRGPAP